MANALLFVITVMVAFVRPYKSLIHNLTETLLLVLIMYVMLNASSFQGISYSREDRISTAVLQLIPHSFVALVIVFKVVKLLLLQTLKVKYKGIPIMDKLTLSYFKAWSWLSKDGSVMYVRVIFAYS